MRLSILLIYGCFVATVSCKSSSFLELSQTPTTQRLTLGSIGSEKDFLLQKDFGYGGLPSYSKPIKLEIKPKVFNKQSFKEFEKAKALQNVKVSIDYIDSLKLKPKYVQLVIADKITLVEAINENENKAVKNYLSHNKYANVLTQLSIAFDKEAYEAITSAEAVFLVEKAPKIYTLEVQNDKSKLNSIGFGDGVVFQYSTSNCCWQEDKRRQLQIVDVVNEYLNCPNNTYKSSNRAKKKVNYFKL